MNWAQEEAKKITELYPDREEYTIASGVSPSGFIHIGNFREIVTTYFIGKELKKLGKKVRFILSFDDFDRFRKVPKGIDPTFEKYIGMPYTAIPSPLGTDKTYAREMEDIFLNELAKLGIYPEVIYETEQYTSGRYNDEIKLSLDKRKEIFDIMSKYRTQDPTEEERNNYYPINLYCEKCKKDSTKVLYYDEQTGNLEYECKCGNKNRINVNNSNNIKLNWKIDWPMRWKAEQVIFEPGGRDHSTENGSYTVSKDIAKEIFNYPAPYYVAYDFIGIKGANGKMASSAGNILTLTDLLRVYDKNIILWFYAKNKPNHQFNIALDEDVLRYYTEFDRMVKSYYNGKADEKNSSIIELIGVKETYTKNPNFSYIANFLPMVSYNESALAKLLGKDGIDCDNIYFQSRLIRAKNWLKEYENEKMKLLEDFNDDYYEKLNDIEKSWLTDTLEILEKEYATTEDLQGELYAIVKKESTDPKEIKKLQKRYFQILYNMFLGTDTGPKMGLFLSAMDYDEILKRLQKNKEKIITRDR